MTATLPPPGLLHYLPLIYIAWADGELSPSEIDQIRGRATDAFGLHDGQEQFLARWLDPQKPPSADELARLLAQIRANAAKLTEAERLSLTDFGCELARVQGEGIQPSEREALDAIADALGVGNQTAAGLLCWERPEPPQAPRPETFPVARLRAALEGPPAEQAVREEVRALLREPAFRHVYGLSKEAYREQVLSWCQVLADRGIGALSYDPPHGGRADLAGFIVAFETLATFDLSLLVKFGVQFGLFGGSIQMLGTKKHHDRYLTDAGSLALPGCFAMTETGHGSNVEDIETTATYDPATETFVIHTPRREARKDWIGNAACHGRVASVFAQLVTPSGRQGVHAIVVPIRDEHGAAMPGVTIEDCGEKLGLNGVDNGRLLFDRVRVPRENLLDRFGVVHADGTYESPILSAKKRFFTILGTLVGGRVSVATGALAAAKVALTIAIRYGDRRRQFGPEGAEEVRILDYRTHQRRLLPRLAMTYALDAALCDLRAKYVSRSEETAREVESLAAGLKAIATWHATDTIQTCREACGGAGYLALNRFAALKADTDVFTTFEGDNTVLLQLVGKGLLTGLKRQFTEMTAMGFVRFFAGMAATAIVEQNPLTIRQTDAAHLRDPAFHLAARRFREDDLVTSVARRLKKRLDAGRDPFEALIACQDHLIAAARAHVDRVVFEHFQAFVASVEDAEARAPLEQLLRLYGLERIEDDRGWFLEQGYIAADKAKAIRKEVNRMLVELRPHAVGLVDAFGIPDSCVGAPIGT